MATYLQNSFQDLVNEKVVIYSGRYRYNVIVVQVCAEYIKAIELGTGNIRTFNIDRIDFIEDCYYENN
ncbi:MAG: hypothetical protein ATN36_07680 [Epulopiscium sp. Nele67-Bin005]|nr:MAG: hypothetical protein ATN36_07680 [Epulopiscium sp. Nele67-Bin005]